MTAEEGLQAAVAVLSAKVYGTSKDAAVILFSYTDEERKTISATFVELAARLCTELAETQQRPVSELLQQIGQQAAK